MESFLTEHGNIIASGMVSMCAVNLIFRVIVAVSNMNARGIDLIIGM